MSDTPPADLGEEWQPGPDGIPYRAAARVLVLDAEGSILLLEGHDDNDLDHRWWFTIGGGIATGEDARTAAGRELAEESGFVVDPAELIGPVATRSALFEFVRHTVRQDEEFFLWRTDRIRPAIATLGGAWSNLKLRRLDFPRSYVRLHAVQATVIAVGVIFYCAILIETLAAAT